MQGEVHKVPASRGKASHAKDSASQTADRKDPRDIRNSRQVYHRPKPLGQANGNTKRGKDGAIIARGRRQKIITVAESSVILRR